MDGVDARQFGKVVDQCMCRRPSDELRVDVLGTERFGEGFVEFGHGRGPLQRRRADGTTFAAL
jgi:hypothetical protein